MIYFKFIGKQSDEEGKEICILRVALEEGLPYEGSPDTEKVSERQWWRCILRSDQHR
jgi:hypothetical protein